MISTRQDMSLLLARESRLQLLLVLGIIACLIAIAQVNRADFHHRDVNFVAKNRTALMDAALTGNEPYALHLIAAGSDITLRDSEGWSALTCAAYSGDLQVVKALIGRHSDLENQTLDGKTPLFFAVMCDHPDIVRVLIDSGCDIGHPDRMGATPLMWAAEISDIATVQMLISEYAKDINARDTRGYSALDVAALSDNIQVVHTLVAHGADCLSKNASTIQSPLSTSIERGDEQIAFLLMSVGAPVNQADRDGLTPLIFAAGNGEDKIVKALLIRGANPNAKSNDGLTPLSFACLHPNEPANIVAMLLARGANPNQIGSDESTPLMFAADRGRTDLVRLLFAHGANAKVVTDRGMTALRYADGQGYVNTVSQILRRVGETE